MTDLKFHFSFNKDGTTKYVQLPAAHCIAEVDHQSNSKNHVPDDGLHFGDLIATPQYDHPQRQYSGHPMLLSTHEDTSTTTASYVSPKNQHRDAGEYHSDMNVPPSSLSAEPQRYDLPNFPNCFMPLPAVSNPAQVEGLMCSAVAMSPHKPAPTTDDSHAADRASTASPSLHENSEHVHATSSAVSSEANHDPDLQSMPSDASVTNSSERDLSPKAESGSVWTGIKVSAQDSAQDSKAPKENHLRVGIHGGKPSSTIIFVQKKVNHKDAWTRSFILKAALMVDHPPDFELPRGSGLLRPNDLFVCVDLSLWHETEDVLSANSISSTSISSSALSSNSSTASSRNDPLRWSDPTMSQYLRIWCWDDKLKVWQPIQYGCSRCISSYDLVLSFYRNTFEPFQHLCYGGRFIKNFVKSSYSTANAMVRLAITEDSHRYHQQAPTHMQLQHYRQHNRSSLPKYTPESTSKLVTTRLDKMCTNKQRRRVWNQSRGTAIRRRTSLTEMCFVCSGPRGFAVRSRIVVVVGCRWGWGLGDNDDELGLAKVEELMMEGGGGSARVQPRLQRRHRLVNPEGQHQMGSSRIQDLDRAVVEHIALKSIMDPSSVEPERVFTSSFRYDRGNWHPDHCEHVDVNDAHRPLHRGNVRKPMGQF
ncbi:hypothetical protein F5879DRAFT_1052228 [Lentinula edodes]|nr:hypothetical protein F5879DRAFT_1052228 [Lentinula edodes]